MSILSTINSAPSLRAFGIEAKKGEAVALKKDGLQAQPAKQGFFGRVMQWVRGENPARINSETKEAFVAAMSRRFGSQAADTALAKTGFYGGNDQPLTSRAIKLAIGYAKIAEDKGAAPPGAAAGAASSSGAGGAAQALKNATNEMLNTRADAVKLTQDVRKLGMLVTKFQISNDPRLAATQAKLADTKQSLAQVRGKLDGQASQIASGAPPVATESAPAQPSAKPLSSNTSDAVPARQEMQQQAKLAREKSRAEQTAQRNERNAARAHAKADHVQQRDAHRVQQRELRAQAKLEHNAEVQQNLRKTRASAESLLAQTSNMVDPQWSALQAEIGEYAGKAEAFSEALARPIDPR